MARSTGGGSPFAGWAAATPSGAPGSTRFPEDRVVDRNAFLAVGLSVLVLWFWTTYLVPHPKHPPSGVPAESEEGSTTGRSGGAPAQAPPPAAPPAPPAAATPGPPTRVPAPPPRPPGGVTEVDTPLVRAELDSVGGVVRRLELKGFRIAPAPTAPPLVLTTGRGDYANALA